MSAHALLSASASGRWLNCTPSARLEETLPDTTSTFATEGSMAHEIAELKVRKHFLEPMGTRAYNNKIKKIKENPEYAGLYQEEMMRHTDTYLDYINKITIGYPSKPYVAAEKKIDYSVYAEGGFGTCDCILIGGDTMHVIDFKYGKGVSVSAENNTQMMLYSLGALSTYSLLYAIDKIQLAIVQPRLDNVSEFEISAADLIAWGERIKPIAEKAFKGEGDFVPGAHCKFCKAKAQCRARANENLSVESFGNKMPPLLNNAEVGQILERAQHLESWLSALKEYALSEVLQGNEIAGWKAVAGRSVRQFTDTDKAFDTLIQNGIDENMLYERKPLTLSGVEKLVGKAKFNDLLTEFVQTPQGKPTLVSVEDKREPIKNKITAQEAFKNI